MKKIKKRKTRGQTKLGLPPEYKKFPEYFDAYNICDDTEATNNIALLHDSSFRGGHSCKSRNPEKK
nr:hypothetical protein [Rickettsia endosymbiont of Ceutorhynchus assimilis]